MNLVMARALRDSFAWGAFQLSNIHTGLGLIEKRGVKLRREGGNGSMKMQL